MSQAGYGPVYTREPKRY